jgi:tetratricopeptide (TPR) repeat protein
MTHLDAETLHAYRIDPALVDAAKVEAHLERCADCRDELKLMEAFDAALGEPAAWEEIEAMGLSAGRAAEALALQASIAEEDAAAARMLAEPLRSPLRFERAKLSGKPRFRTAGVVRALCAAAHKLHEERPRFSRDVAAEAGRIARQLPETHPLRRVCMGRALRESATALRYLGRFKEALQVLDDAETLANGTPSADAFDLAFVWFGRAAIYMKSERLNDAIPLARKAAAVFRDYGDDFRECSAVLLEACCHLLLGAADRAAIAFEHVIASAEKRHDYIVLASALNNAAVTYTDLRQFERATSYYSRAVVLYDELTRTTEAARARWALASLLVASGDLDRGIGALAAAREELTNLGLTNDAALATLEWAEARLAAERPEDVADACRAIVVTFDSEGMERSARVALAYLHEALSKGTATPAFVRHVRDYLRDLPSEPERAFSPLS